MTTRTVTVDRAPLSDGAAPYMRGRNGITALGSLEIDAWRLPGAVRLELRSPRWTSQPPALAMMHPATARALAAALVSAADEADPAGSAQYEALRP